MNSPKEPEPEPGRCAAMVRTGNDAGRILRMASRGREQYVRVPMREEFVSG
jgi:hypothetical protein